MKRRAYAVLLRLGRAGRASIEVAGAIDEYMTLLAEVMALAEEIVQDAEKGKR